MSRRIVPLLAGLVAGVAAVVAVFAIADDARTDTDVVLDEPGEYQEPGIPTNAPLTGERLGVATVVDLDGNEVDTGSLLDGRPLLVNFWFSNCQPCKREMPALQAAFLRYGDTVRFVGVNTQDSETITRSFADDVGVTYELLRDPDARLVTVNGVATFPTTLFVAPDGTVVRQIAGEVSAAELTTALDELVGGTR